MALGYWLGLVWNKYFFISLLISALTAIFVSYRYQVLLRYYGEKILFFHSLWVTYLSALFSYIFPIKIGSIITKPAATKFFSKIPIKRGVFVSIFEQFFESGWQAILFFFMILFVGEKFLFNNVILEAAIFVAIAITSILMFLNYEKVINLLWKFKNLLPKRIKKIAKKANLSQESTKEAMANAVKYASNLKLLLILFLITLPFILVTPFILIELAKIFSLKLPYLTAFIAFWFSVIVGRMSYLPGGFGSREVTIAGLLIMFGVPTGISLKLTILTRIVTLIPVLLIGGIVLVYVSSKVSFKKFVEKYGAGKE